jgi:GNAT superfamily N-acetyltransferase
MKFTSVLNYEICPLGYNSEIDANEYYCNVYMGDSLVAYCKYYDANILLEGVGVTIEYIYVSEEYRRRGIATNIANFLKEKYTNLIWNNQFTEQGRLWYNSYSKHYEQHNTKRQRI